MIKFKLGERVLYKNEIYFVYGYIPYWNSLLNCEMNFDKIISYIIAKDWQEDLIDHKVVKENEIEHFNKDLKNLKNNKKHFNLTIGELKEIIKDMLDEGLVLFERIEDKYFTDNSWITYEDISNNSQEEFIQASGAYTKYNHLLINGHF